MYRPSAYYAANWLAAATTYCMYPVISCCLTWYFLDLTDSSFGNLMAYVGSCVLLAICGLNFGIMVSILMGHPLGAIIVMAAMAFLYGMGGGQIVNIGGEDPAGFFWFN